MITLTSCRHTGLRATPSAMRELARVLERGSPCLITANGTDYNYTAFHIADGSPDALICAEALRRVSGA